MTEVFPYETWMPVIGFEQSYRVSDRGRVQSLKTGTYLKGTPNPKSGYVLVTLCQNRTSTNVNIHTLVLTAFVGPRPDGKEACHWNDVPGDNALANLRWDTRAANRRDAIRNGHRVGPKNQARGERTAGAFLCEDDVRCIRAEPYFSGVLAMLSGAFGISKDHVWKIRQRHMWAHVQ